MPIDKETMSGLYRSIFQEVFASEYNDMRNHHGLTEATRVAVNRAILAVEFAEEEGLL